MCVTNRIVRMMIFTNRFIYSLKMEMWIYLRCGANNGIGIGLMCNRRMLFGIELLVTTTSKNELGLVCYQKKKKKMEAMAL